METLNRKKRHNAFARKNPYDRYQCLAIKESLSKPYLYTYACEELSFLIKKAYSNFSKDLESLIYEDTLFAFSLLPHMKTQSAISSANGLLRCADSAFPKQKRASAVSAYKQAVVASKRKSKTNKEERVLRQMDTAWWFGLPKHFKMVPFYAKFQMFGLVRNRSKGFAQLPLDVLVSIFSFLDLQSLLSASAVCRLWNNAAGDNLLWKLLYKIYFHNSHHGKKSVGLKAIEVVKDKDKIIQEDSIITKESIDCRSDFKAAYKVNNAISCGRRLKTRRGYCSRCLSVVWLSRNQRCIKTNTSDDHDCLQEMKFMSIQEIVDFVLEGSLPSESSWHSHSDGELNDSISHLSRFWAYPSLKG